MKFGLSATIAIYFLLTLLFSTLYTHASQEKIEKTTTQHIPQNYKIQNHENRAKILVQKWTIFSKLLDKKHKLHLLQQQFLLQSKTIPLYLIVNQFLACKDILILQKTCRFFQNLLQPNRSNMVTFRNYADSQKMTETTIIWDALKYLQNYYSVFDRMEMFNIKDNQYAVLTPEKQIIVWTNNVTPYPQILLHQPTNNAPLEVFNNTGNSWAIITKEGNIETCGNIEDGGDSRHVQSQLKNVKMIASTLRAFAVLLNDGRVVAWGSKIYGGKIPDDIQPQLHNVEMIFSTDWAFAALLDDGRVLCWGNEDAGGKIPDNIQPELQNFTKMIVSNSKAFVALLNDGNVLCWGHESYSIPDHIQPELHNVRMIFSNSKAFAALLNDGSVLGWGHGLYGGTIPHDIQRKLHNVTKMIFSTISAFAALLNDGSVLCWGNQFSGGKIPYKTQKKLAKVTKMIFSTDRAFAALLNDGSVLCWGDVNAGGKIPDNIQPQLHNVKMIIPDAEEFTAVCINGDTFTW